MENSNAPKKKVDIESMSLEELILWLQENESEEGLKRLFAEMRDAVKTIMFNFYPAFLPTYDIDDMFQEANIAMWKAIKNYKLGKGWKAKSFMELVVKRRFIRIHESYYTKNPYILYASDDDYTEEGLVNGTMVESAFRKRNLEKKREWNNKWRERHGLKPCKPRVKKTPEEIKQHQREKQKEYYERVGKKKLQERYQNMSPEEKEKRRIARHERYIQNRELELLQVKLYKERHPEKCKEYRRIRQQRKKERLAAEAQKKNEIQNL